MKAKRMHRTSLTSRLSPLARESCTSSAAYVAINTLSASDVLKLRHICRPVPRELIPSPQVARARGAHFARPDRGTGRPTPAPGAYGRIGRVGRDEAATGSAGDGAGQEGPQESWPGPFTEARRVRLMSTAWNSPDYTWVSRRRVYPSEDTVPSLLFGFRRTLVFR